VLFYDFDNLSDMTTELCWIDDQKDLNGNIMHVLITELVWVDRTYLYQEIWRHSLKALYEKYLPEFNYEAKWNGEITPYTLMLCRLADAGGLQKRFLYDKWQSSGTDLEEFCAETTDYFNRIGIDLNGLSPALQKCLPADRLERYDQIYRLLAFPPLRELTIFYEKVHQKYTEALKELGTVFCTPDVITLPSFKVFEIFLKSEFYFDHHLFEKFGLDWASSQPELAYRIADIGKVKDKAKAHEGKFSGKFVCPCCGTIEDATVPVKVLEYKYLWECDGLARDMAFLLLPKIEERYREETIEKLNYVIANLNNRENASVLVLVEGASEEHGLPILALKRQFSLPLNKVQIYNSGSKEQLLRDFKQFRNQFTHLKIICLLDNDAQKEKAELERIMRNGKNKYELVFLGKGTWEDLFPLATSVAVLNKMYPDGNPSPKVILIRRRTFSTRLERYCGIKRRPNSIK